MFLGSGRLSQSLFVGITTGLIVLTKCRIKPINKVMSNSLDVALPTNTTNHYYHLTTKDTYDII